MAKRAELERFARRLQGLVSARDWEAIAALDQEIASHLRNRRRSLWSEAEQHAFLDLQRVHAHARECCEQESAQLQERLARMRANRDAWIAYGLSNEFDEARS